MPDVVGVFPYGAVRREVSHAGCIVYDNPRPALFVAESFVHLALHIAVRLVVRANEERVAPVEHGFSQQHKRIRILRHKVIRHEPIEHVLQVFILRIDAPRIVSARAQILNFGYVHAEYEHIVLADRMQNFDIRAVESSYCGGAV